MASISTTHPADPSVLATPARPELTQPIDASPIAAHPREQFILGRAATAGAGINWLTATVLVAFHAGAIAALFFFTWQRLLVAAILYILAINFGIGMCYHRLLTHRGYQTPKWLEYLMTFFATLALEGGPIFWVSTHRVHHQLSDQPGDPHTPRDGAWWAHMEWLLFGDNLHAESEALTRYSPDLNRDGFHRWISKYHWIPLTLSGPMLFAGGWYFGGTWVSGLAFVLWGAFLRVTIGLHTTWLVNSATHLWGSRRFATRDDSRNSWWVALLSGGEGWHNNHHAHPVSARHGLTWYEVDPNYWGIWILSKLGLARKIQIAKYDRKNPKPASAGLGY